MQFSDGYIPATVTYFGEVGSGWWWSHESIVKSQAVFYKDTDQTNQHNYC